MFEAAEVGNQVAKVVYKREAEKLRERLLAAQKRLAEGRFSAVVLVSGVEGSGKTTFTNLLLEWLDARGIQVHAMGDPSDEEGERPRFWRYWRALPPKGKLAVFLGSWYTDPIVDRVFKRTDSDALDVALEEIEEFETMLSREGIKLVKLWFHLAKEAQEERLAALQKATDTRWRVTPRDWRFFKRYDRFRKVSAHALSRTSSAANPWQVVEAADFRYRNLSAARHLLKALEEGAAAAAPSGGAKPALPKPKRPNVISRLDLTLELPQKEYDAKLEKWQGRLNLLTRRLREARRSMILVLEGPDAGGKGGAIRRLTQAMDARNYRVISTAAPTEDERAHPYLWRFWRDLPRVGCVTIYDRSWYGRVLVERLEGFCAPEDWRRAFAEINAFESQLADFGTVILKLWLAVSPDEQLRRFKDRELTPYKQYKIGEEDWRNRSKWDAYEAAAVEMIERTSTDEAPWVPIEANGKRHARVRVLRTVCKAIAQALD